MSENVTTKLKYNVITVEKTTPPEGMPGENWYRYVIGQGTSRIEGIRHGSLKDVTQHAEAFAEDLNLRMNSSGSTYAPRKRANPSH
ncbi:MAG TPA: hypothetical protein VIQ03_16010 [Gammaproteobacteria bacterium]